MDQELIKQYSCSLWSKRFKTSEEVMDHHYKFTEEASRYVQIDIPNESNVSYGLEAREKMGIFGIDLPKNAPILVFVHGGYWQTKTITHHTYSFIARTFYAQQILTILLSYELCPDVTFKEVVRKFATAAKKCITYAKEHGSKGLFFVGHSAGAHLVSTLFTDQFITKLSNQEQKLVKGAILLSGIYDLSPIEKTTLNEALQLNQKNIQKLSPLKNEMFNGAGTKFLVLVGADESPEFRRQSKELYEKLVGLKYNVGIFELESCDHYNIVEGLSELRAVVTQHILGFISQNL